MENNDSLSIIHKKARVAREDFDARAMSPAKALRLAFAQAAEDDLDMALVVTTLEQTKVNTAALTEALEEDKLLILLDGADGARGAAILDTQVVAALIEIQLTGTVREGEARARHYTRTDAAMMAPLLDAGLAGADAFLAEQDEAYEPRGFRFGDRVEDARVLSLALQGLEFDLFQMTVSVENGAKSGTLSLALPQRQDPPRASHIGAQGTTRPTASLKKLAMDAPVTLIAVLSRIRRPLNEICRFEPGMLLPVAPEAIGQAELVARPTHLVAEGRLGQVGGMRAIRIDLRQDDAEPPHASPGPATAHASSMAAAGSASTDPALLDLSALEPDPDLQATPELLDLPALDALDEPMGELPDLDGADMDLSQWEDDPGAGEESGEAGDFPVPDPLPALDLP